MPPRRNRSPRAEPGTDDAGPTPLRVPSTTGTAAFSDLSTALVAVVALVTVGCAGAADRLGVEDVVERHTAAVADSAALDSVQRLRVHLRILEPGFTLEGVYRVDRRGRMRIDVYSDGRRVFTEAYDGETGWQMGADGTSATTADDAAAEALWRGTQYPSNIVPLHEVDDRGHRLELVGRDTVDDVAYHVLRLTLSDGFETDWYVHPETWLLERRRDVRALHPDQDPTEQRLETRWSDFRSVAGVLRPFRSRQVDLATGEVLQRTEVEGIVVNPDFPVDVFVRPR